MKVEAIKQPAGFSPIELTMTFETPEELYAFQLRMSGNLNGVEVNGSLLYSPQVKPNYSHQVSPVKKVDLCKLSESDHCLVSKVSDVLRKLENK
jgi:hypothetical protein